MTSLEREEVAVQIACDDCVDIDDPRYDGYHGCLSGSIYGFCEDPICSGLCVYLGYCGCICHKESRPS